MTHVKGNCGQDPLLMHLFFRFQKMVFIYSLTCIHGFYMCRCSIVSKLAAMLLPHIHPKEFNIYLKSYDAKAYEVYTFWSLYLNLFDIWYNYQSFTKCKCISIYVNNLI